MPGHRHASDQTERNATARAIGNALWFTPSFKLRLMVHSRMPAAFVVTTSGPALAMALPGTLHLQNFNLIQLPT
jgi:hypothetical protein